MPRQCRILLVEDEEQVSTVLEDAIEIDGYDVEVVRSGPDALARADFTKFDVLITDVTLRGGSTAGRSRIGQPQAVLA